MANDIWDELAIGADISHRQIVALRDALPENQARILVEKLDDNERRAALKLGLTANLLADFYRNRSDEQILALIQSLHDAESGPEFTQKKVIRFTRSNKNFTPDQLFDHLTNEHVARKYSGDIYTHPGCDDLRKRAESFFAGMADYQRSGDHVAVADGLSKTLPELQAEFAQRAKELNLAPIVDALPGARELFGEKPESSS